VALLLALALPIEPSLSVRTPEDSQLAAARKLVHTVPLGKRSLDTKAYLDEAWEVKGRSGLVFNSGLSWNSTARQWSLRSTLSDQAQKSIAHYASWTAIPARFAVNVAETYRELDKIDELAKFYGAFLKVHFTTLGSLRKTTSGEVQQTMLGRELGPDSTQTLAWYWKQGDGGVILRECYLCNADYFYPAARLLRLIARLSPGERTAAMKQFAGDYTPLLVNDHVLRPGFTDRMRQDLQSAASGSQKQILIEDEIDAIGTAAEILGAYAADSKLVAISDTDRSRLKDLVSVGVARFQLSRTLSTDADGRKCASYLNGDYDWHEDMAYARYQGESFPRPDQKAQAQGASWDISHFSLIPLVLWSLFQNKQGTGVDFPTLADLNYISNQYAFHVFRGDLQRPLFSNFFDGSDGWYRVNYSGRSNYGIAPSRYCNMFDPSHGCTSVAGIYSWGLLAYLNADVARVQIALIDLARSNDPAIACFQKACFRERYYWYGESSFSFLDPGGETEYPPALLVVLSDLVLSLSQAPG
jgi:hypothetical protein